MHRSVCHLFLCKGYVMVDFSLLTENHLVLDLSCMVGLDLAELNTFS